MKWTQRLVAAVRRSQSDQPKPGRVIFQRPEESIRDYPSAGLTPSRLAAVLREADEGSLGAAMQLFEEMEEKDPHLYAVANTRRLALTGLPWQIVSTAESQDGASRVLADEAADYCREVLSGLDSFDELLQHLALALGRNIAIGEIVWDVVNGRLRPVQFVPIDFARIVFDDLDRPRILTDSEPKLGIEPAPNKFVVHTPHSVGSSTLGTGHPQRGGLLRVSAMAYLAKNMAMKDWMIYCELFGMPVRIARCQPNATAEEKREMLSMLESLGSHAAGVFSSAVELEFVQAGRGASGPPFENLVEFLNREVSKAWLGQTLTTDIVGNRGSLAATSVHDLVRQDLLADDVRKEGVAIRRDVLGAMTRMQFGPDVPVPRFRRKVGRPGSATELARVLDLAVNRLGLEIPARWAREALGVPATGKDEPSIPGRPR